VSDFKPLQDLVERSQRIGADQNLVVYGGGNTSSKGEISDHLGRRRKVLWVKGSGADMQYAVDRDYPALYLDELLALEEFQEMSDELMVDYVTRALVDPTSRRPSIETLLHGFLPAKHIDHVHADAICSLTNHPRGEEVVREVFGSDFAYVDWLRPGFELSKLVGKLKNHAGVILAHHGLVVWDDESEKCYQKTLDAVERANSYLDSLEKKPEAKFTHRDISNSELREILLQLRGKLGKKQILKVDRRLVDISRRDDLNEIISAGVSSADHMLRIRPKSLAIDPNDLAGSVDRYRKEHEEYFSRNKHLLSDGFSSHGDDPKVMLYPGLGAITVAPTMKENLMLGDIALHTHSVAAKVRDCFGEARTIPESEIFGFDYWPMELFKLKSRPKPKLFEGNVFIVTGAGSGIGRGIALYLAKNGANLILADISKSGLDETYKVILDEKGEKPHLVIADQSDIDAVAETVQEAIMQFGGLDGAVINAGIGVPGNLEELSLDLWEKGLRVNLTSAFLMTKEVLKVLRTQAMGGSLVYIASKNAFSPGAGFGGYSVTKAGMIQLMRIAALEGGGAGIRANAINPDAVFDNSLLWAGGVREQRAAAHGVKPEELEDFYAARNLLKAKVRSEDVAEMTAFLLSESSSRTTGSVIAVDGGVAGAFPR
jgi:rhamnulose-1-phosphate aldolase/alcohol dehydrogenase